MPVVYAILGKQTRRVKLGKTSARTAGPRLREIQPFSADDLVLLGEAAGRPDRDERWLHAYFDGFRLHGEWFAPHVADVLEDVLKRETFTQFVDRIAAHYDHTR